MTAAGRAVWSAYRGAGWVAAPLAAAWLARRARRGKEEPARTAEKRGIASRAPFAARPVWVHAVSVGESVAALAVAEALAAQGWPIVLTTTTRAAAERVAADASAAIVHQYAPLDSPRFVLRFLAHWRPVAALFTEGEIWPATIMTLGRAGVPFAVVNARLSDRTFSRWSRRRWLAEPLFGAIAGVFAQSEAQARRFAALGAPGVRTCGNLKFDAPPPPADPAALEDLRRALAGRPVWLAASTHPGEEAAVIAAHRRLAAGRPDLVTVVAPRHPERGGAIAAAGGGAPRLSRGDSPRGGLFVADTLGELGTFFALAPIVFLGGSLVPLGGHNPAEPAAHGAALLTGPHHGEMFVPFLAADAARVVADAAALADAVEHLMRDDGARAAMAARAAAVLERERGVLERTLAGLAEFLPGRAAA